ncbi:SDR family NAD(P)-dependent oxidoreductase [Bounagaea algeriensis]
MDYTHLFRLDRQTAFVLGAGSGIGREAAGALAAHGAHVVCADRDIVAAKETAAQLDGRSEAYQVDVLDPDAASAAAADFPDADTLVFTPATNVRKRLLEYTSEDYDQVTGLNLRSSFDLIRAFGGNMVQRERGSIIGLSSIRHQVVEPGQGLYAASKAAVVQLLRTAAAEFGPSGVRANAIAPGVVDTPLTTPIKDQPDWYQAYAEKTALGRWSKPEEVAGAVVYLASEAASYVTGTVVYVDGGWTAVDGRYEPPSAT